MTDEFFQFSAVIGIATIVAVVMRLVRQPLILAYIFAGVLLGVFRLVDVQGFETLKFLPEIGIAFLLFLVGMELDMRELKQVGRAVVSASLIQVGISFGFTLILALGLGLFFKESVYLALAFGFSSTILVIKFLIERRTLHALQGRLAIGILLIEDLIAVMVLMFLSIYNSTPSLTQNFQLLPFIWIVVKGFGLFYVLLFLMKRVLPRAFRFVATSPELLFLSTIAWCLVFVSLVVSLGFSLGIGAFLAGIALAPSPYRFQIASKIRPLRDLFIAVFFIDLGTQVQFLDVPHLLGPIIAFSLFVLISKPLIFMTILGRLGYQRYTFFMTSIMLTQISEFSLILVAVGRNVGHVSPEGVTIATVVGIITLSISSLAMTHAGMLYRHSRHALGVFERRERQEEQRMPTVELSDHVILIGCHRIGELIADLLQRKKETFVVVDSNPDIVTRLQKRGIQVFFGGVADPDVYDQLNFPKAKLVISTITDFEDNIMILRELRRIRAPARIVMTADFPNEAYELYKYGAHYVILPYTEAGNHIVHLLQEHLANLSFFDTRIEQRMKDAMRWGRVS